MASRDEDISTNITGRAPVPGMDFSASTLEEETLGLGWTRITKPVGGEPAPAIVAGSRGDIDMDVDLLGGKPSVIDEG